MNAWYVYLLRCADDSLYAGITTDLQRRLNEHNGVAGYQGGSRYTRSRRPVVLVYHEACDSRSQASKREAVIKRLPRLQKLRLIAQADN